MTALTNFCSPTAQGLATCTAVQRRGIESKLLMFPDENHWELKPADPALCYHKVMQWLDGFLER